MANLNEKEFIASIKANEIANLYYLYGEEKYLINYYQKSLVLKLLDKNLNDFNYTIFDYNDVTIDDIESEIESLPFLCEKKCILIKYFNPETILKNDIKRLIGAFSKIPENTIVILKDNNRDINYKKAAKIKSFSAQVAKIGNSIQFDKRDKKGLIKFILSKTKAKGVIMNESDAAYIIDNCSDDIEILTNEIDKIINFSTGYKENENTSQSWQINKNDIEKLITKRQDAGVFEIVNLILKGNENMLFKKLNELFYQREDPIAITAILSSSFIDLYRAKASIENGIYFNDIITDFNYGNLSFKIRNALRDCEKIKIQTLRKAIKLISETDLILKSTSFDKNICLEKLVTQLLLIVQRG